MTDWDEVARLVLYFMLIQHSRTYDSGTVFVCVEKSTDGCFFCVSFFAMTERCNAQRGKEQTYEQKNYGLERGT